MTPLALRLAARLLPADVRAEVMGELLERYQAIAARDGRAAAGRWAWRQPAAALAARLTWGRPAVKSPRRHLLSGLNHDVVVTWRGIRRRPGTAVAVVVTVAISVSALSVAAGVIDAVLFRPFPYPNADQLVWLKTISTKDAPSTNPRGPANPDDAADWARAKTIAALTTIEGFDGTVLTAEGPVRANVAQVNATVGATLGIRAATGRLFTTADYAPGTRVAVLTNRFWRAHFASDPSIVGRSIDLSGSRVTIAGILPDLPIEFPDSDTDLWMPLAPAPGGADDHRRGGVWESVVARLRPGVSIDEAQTELSQIATALGHQFPRTNATRTILVQPFRDGRVGSTRQVLTAIGGAVAIVLLMACANVGHLLLVTAQSRQREFSVRRALGASTWRVARIMLVESATLWVAGGLVGLAMAPPLLRAFLAFYPDGLPSIGEVTISGTAIGVAIVATLAAAVASAIPPLAVARTQSLGSAMRATDRGSDSRGQRLVRIALVLAQVSMSTTLLVGGGLLVRTFWSVRSTALGFNVDDVLTFNVALPNARYSRIEDESRFYEALSERLRAIPGVTGAGASSLLPLADGDFRDGFTREGMSDQPPNVLPGARLQVITPGYLEALGLPVRAGRSILPSDTATSTPVAVVNEQMVRRYFPGGAVGRRIRFRGRVVEIVGVVGDKRHHNPREDVQPDLYVPRPQSENPRFFGWVLVRTTGRPDALTAAIRQAVRDVDPEVSVASIETMEHRVRGILAPDRFRAIVVGSLAGIALLLAAVGLYGLIAHTVALGARDTAIRMALGASARGTVGLILRDVLILAVTGIAAGLTLALAGTIVLRDFVAGVTTHDPMTLVVVAAMLLTVAIVAAAGPAIRASRIDPAQVLKAG